MATLKQMIIQLAKTKGRIKKLSSALSLQTKNEGKLTAAIGKAKLAAAKKPAIKKTALKKKAVVKMARHVPLVSMKV